MLNISPYSLKMLFSLLLAVGSALGTSVQAKADDYDIARTNRLAILAGPPSFSTSDPAIAAQISSIDAAANANWTSMETGSGRTELWSDLTFPTGTPNTLSAHVTSTYGRLKTMAKAYGTYGSTLNGNSAVLAAVLDGLDWMNTNKYSSTTSQVGNWWDWQIGSPLALNDVLVLVYPGLSALQISTTVVPVYVGAIRHFTNSPSGTGANLMWTSEIVSLSGVLIKNSAQVQKGITSAPTVLNIVTGSDGFYADGSFIQHSYFPYTGGYGIGLIIDLIDFTTVYNGTQWALPTTTVDREVDYLFKSYQPVVYKGEMLDDLRGREISRVTSASHGSGRNVLGAFLRSATFASNSADITALKSAAKYWLQTDTTFTSYTDGFDIRTILLAEAVYTNGSVTPMAEQTGFHLFSGMDRVAHLRPGWGASVSMSSSRRANYESINSENLKAWHTGDGMLYLYDADLNQHSVNFWPTVNNYNLEGTTVAMNSTSSAGHLSTSNFVGGVPSWDGVYGVAAMSFAPTTSLSAKKAWFFLDNQIFCLGANISSTASTNIETVITNRKLSSAGTNTVTTDNGTSSASPDAEPATPRPTTLPITYLHIAGSVTGSSVGYFFPTATTLMVSREARTHAWSEINQNANYIGYTTLNTNNYYTAFIDHGAQPISASYAYAVLPNISAPSLISYAASPEVSVLENSGNIQAISDSKLGATAAVFWQAASYTAGSGASSITSDSRAAVFVTNTGSQLQVNITDPTQANTGTIHISLGRGALSVIDKSASVTVTQLTPTVEIAVAATGLAGQPASVRLNLSGPVPIIVDNATNTGGSSVTVGGAWTSSTGSAGYYGTDYLHDGNTGKGTKTVTFTPYVPTAGSYDVQINYSTNANRATNVPVQINSASGTANVVVNQTTGGSWSPLGTYTFAAGTAGNIVISNTGTNGYVIADAIRLVAH